MNKKLTTILVAFFSVALGLSLVDAKQEKWYEPGSQSGREATFKNIRAGYNLFRENCKSCHYRENDKNASFLCPDSKTMKGWNRVFARKNLNCEKNGCLNALTQAELMNLNDYLYTHARDVADPNDELECGI